MKKIYIAGPITGVPDYMRRFNDVEMNLRNAGWNVVNPAKNKGSQYKDYIDVGLRQLMECDAIYLLDGYSNSPGATLEFMYAWTINMPIYPFGITLPKGWGRK